MRPAKFGLLPALVVLGFAAHPGCVLAQAAPAAPAASRETATIAAVPSGPEAQAFQAALAAETAALAPELRAAITTFYATRGFEPYWTETADTRGDQLIAALETSPRHALPLRRYDPGALSVLFETSEAEAPVAMKEVAATRTYLSFAQDLAAGILTPSKVDEEISLSPERPRPAALLLELAAAPLPEVLAGLAPKDADYARLMAELARLEGLAQSGAWGAEVSTGPTLHVDEMSPRVREIRSRLTRIGYGVPDAGPAPDRFDAALAETVKAFQRDHGLNDDGAVGARTLRALNAGVDFRLRQVAVNLERLRWSDRTEDARHIYVNIPDYRVTLFDGGQPVWSTRSVVGEAEETRTPEFSDVMSYMVVNPSWHIPDSIILRDYLPQLKQDPDVLARNGMQLTTRSGTEIDPRLVDFSQFGTDSFPFRIRQLPSDDNALGRVKFMFPNEFAIYLHDTPHRELFAKDARAFSNGCIRLQDPLGFAYLLLDGQVENPQAAFAGWLEAGTERQVNLERPIPVHLEYRTVFADTEGVVRFRSDVYGRDAAVFEALEAAGVTFAAAQG